MAEVSLRAEAGSDLSWVGQSLDAACRRFQGAGPSPHIVSTVHIPEHGLLSCIVRAASREDVLRLFEISLLPSARVLDVVVVEAKSPEAEPG
jgi:hypothetical protein